MMDEIEHFEPVQFPPPMSEAEQWRALKFLLADKETREGLFTDAVERRMNRRKRVNITKISTKVTEVLGDEYGFWARDVLRTAASRTDIEVIG
jgi:hypothetical protein